MEGKKKNNVIVVAPYDKNILKAIFNAMMIDLLKIIIIGSKSQIETLCQEIHLNSGLLNIVDCEETKINLVLEQMITEKEIHGIVYGHFEGILLNEVLKPNFEVEILNFATLKQLLFVANLQPSSNSNITEKKDYIIETKKIMNDFMIFNHIIGLVTEEKTKMLELERKVLKRTLLNGKIDIISTKQIFRGRHNLLAFKNHDASMIFTETAKMSMHVKAIKIKKASSHYLIDAFEKEFKDIFFSFVLLSRLVLQKAEIQTQVS